MGNLGFVVRALTTWLTPKPQLVLGATMGREERRRAPRDECEVQLTATAPNGDVYGGYSREISDAGMGALLWGDLTIGTEVLLNCRCPDVESKITLHARVCQRVGFRYGLEFQLGQDRDDAVAVQRLLCCAAQAQGPTSYRA